jgi:hypothetical protein
VKGSERISLLPFAAALADRRRAAVAANARVRVSRLGFVVLLASQ